MFTFKGMKWLCRTGGMCCLLVALPLLPVLVEWGFVFLLLAGGWVWAAREVERIYYDTDPES